MKTRSPLFQDGRRESSLLFSSFQRQRASFHSQRGASPSLVFSRLLSSSLVFSRLLSSSLFFSLLFSFVFCGDGFVCVRRPFEGIEGQSQMGLSSQSVKDFPSAKGLVFSFLEPTAKSSSALFEAASSSHAQPRISTFSKTRKTLHCYSN